MDYPKRVQITEVGPRDGLQNENAFVPTAVKVDFINLLSQTGLQHIEATSFVSPRAIPQLADGAQVMQEITRYPGLDYSVLIPNEKGMLKALEYKVKSIALFTAASESFNQKNINCSIEESLERFSPVIATAKAEQIKIRAYISCALGCPYEGTITPKQVASVLEKLLAFGVDEVSFGDTIGVGTPKQTSELIKTILTLMPKDKIVLHFHDTYGQAIANILTSLQLGLYRFDSSTAGLGGCPYARGASGNVATEDVLYLLHGLGIETGVDIYKIVAAGDMICKALKKKNPSKVANALLGNQGG